MAELKRLFEPIRIGQMELKNRIKLPSLGLGYDDHMEVSDRLKNFYIERAKGGAGLIGISCTATRLTTEGIFVGIWDDRYIPGLRELAEIIHAHGAKAYVQIGTGYAWAFGGRRVEFVTPSGVTATGRPRPTFRFGTPPGAAPRVITVDEIHEIVEGLGEAARRARDAGFDAVEVIASTGYILSQFLSPVTNKRTDEYGGSLENRARILLETTKSMRKKAGEDYTYLYRLSGSDFLKDGYSIEDTKAVAAMLEKAGVHSFDAMPGWHEAPVPMVQMSVSQGAFAYLAEELKKAVSVPVAAGNTLSDPFVAEQILSEGKADLVWMARALIADPELPNKAKEGRLEDIRPCIACCNCLDTLGGPISCTVNARAGREGVYVIKPAVKPKEVFIIGSGPAGLEAARVLAQRGHRCTLFEGGDGLGGQLLLADIAPHKGNIDKIVRYLVRQVEKAGVDIRLGEEASVNAIVEAKPDVVVVATGARPAIPEIPGIEKGVTAWDVLQGRAEVGDRVLVIGGGMVGCEVAEFLAQKKKQVTIIEMLRRIASDIGRITAWEVIMRLGNAGVRMETSVRVLEITDKGVKGVREGQTEFFEGDSVVLAMGSEANDELAKELKGKVAELHLIGDCAEPRKIINAIEDGVRVACEI